MNTSTKVVMALPPVIISCLLFYFRNDLMPEPDPQPKEPSTQTIVAPQENPSQEDPGKGPDSTVDAQETPGGTAEDKPAENIPQKEESVERKSGQALLEEIAPTLGDNPLWLLFARHPKALEVFVKATEQLANGNRPLAIGTLEFMPKPTPFRADRTDDGSYVISQETEQRFAPVLDAICSIPPDKAAELIKKLEPDLDAIIHDKFGYPPDTTFKKLYLEALNTILTTPVPEKPLQLVRITDTLYKYAIPEMEELPEAQKFILRLGIANQTRLANYAKELWKNHMELKKNQ